MLILLKNHTVFCNKDDFTEYIIRNLSNVIKNIGAFESSFEIFKVIKVLIVLLSDFDQICMKMHGFSRSFTPDTLFAYVVFPLTNSHRKTCTVY